jgi:hypothetical protein
MRKTVAAFSLEKSKESLQTPMICAAARVEQQKFRAGFLDKLERRRLQKAAMDLTEAPLYIDDTAGISLMEIHAKLRRLKAERDIGLVVVDYLQLMSAAGRFGNRNEEVSYLSRGLKMLAKELNVPMLVLSGGNVQTESISEKLRANNVKFESIRLGCEADSLEEIEERFERGEIDVLLAPVETIKEGLKPANIRSLFLVTPTYFRDEMAEFLRELNSKTDQNRVKIYDYVDTRVGILKNFFRIRSYSYGIKLQSNLLEP